MSEQNPGCLSSTARGCGHLIQGVLLTIGVVFVIVALFGGAAYWLSVLTESTATPPTLAAAEAPTGIISASEPEPPRPPVAAPTATFAPTSTPLPAVPVGLTFDEICGVSGSDMTDPQLEAHVANYVGRSFENWQGWVYDVTHYGDTYDLLIAMEPRGLFLWSRQIVVEDIAQDVAFSLSIEDAITFSGHVARIDTTFDVACNPLYVDQFVLK